MRRAFDPFEILRRLNPVDPETLPGPSRSSDAQRLLEAILRGDLEPKTRPSSFLRARFSPPTWRRRRRLLVGAILVALGVAAVAWALTRGGGTELTVGCYQRADLQAKTVVVAATGEAPTTVCRRQWLAGVLGAGTPPSLQACVLPSGSTGVFPSESGDTCRRLGLTPAGPHRASPAVRLKEVLVDKFLTAGCLDQQEATALVRTELEHLQIPGWTISVTAPFSEARPCASLAFDEAHHRLLLVPIPRG